MRKHVIHRTNGMMMARSRITLILLSIRSEKIDAICRTKLKIIPSAIRRFFQKISWSDAIGWLIFGSLHWIFTGFFSQIFAGSSISSQTYTPVRTMSNVKKKIKSILDFRILVIFTKDIFTFSNCIIVKSWFMNPGRASIYRLRGQKPNWLKCRFWANKYYEFLFKF